MKIKNYILDQETIPSEEYIKQLRKLMADAETEGDD